MVLKKWYEYPLKFSSFRTFFIYDYTILLKISESFLYKRYILILHYGDNSQTGRYNFGSHNKVLCLSLLESTFNLIYVMYFQYPRYTLIKAFYLKKLHFNCTFTLDPVSIIYNYKHGFEEMIWISIEKIESFYLKNTYWFSII
jgi:hypothetical protein